MATLTTRVKVWIQINYEGNGHPTPIRYIFYYTVAIDTGVYWHYGNNQIMAITRCTALYAVN